MIMSRDQNAGRSHIIKIGSSSFEKAEKFKYLIFINEENKSRLKGGNACCHSVHNLLYPMFCPKINILRHTELQFCLFAFVWV